MRINSFRLAKELPDTNKIRLKAPAFTLAEVLITLGIIGVVAAMTMPTLIKTYQKQVALAQLKENYSLVNQAIKLAEVQNGEVKYWDFTDAEKILFDYIAPNIKSKKFSGKEHKYGSLCFSETALNYKFLDGSTAGVPLLDNSPSIKLPTGACIGLNRGNIEEDTGRPSPFASIVYLDINGSQQTPNMLGKDLFLFKIGERGELVPYTQGINIKNAKNCLGDGCCNKEALYGGRVCAAVIMYDSWQMKDDYPW